MRNLLLMVLLVPGVSIIFAYTKANIWSFWLGVTLCLSAESALLLFYCFLKLQKAYRDSFTIRLTENYDLSPSQDYPFRPLVVANDFYLNRFTEQARLTNKKMSLKSPEFEQQLEEIIINEVPYKEEIQEYIRQIRNKYHYLNKFNAALIEFGARLQGLPDNSLIIPQTYSFAQGEQYFQDDGFAQEFREEERRAFNELRIKLKSPKLKPGEAGPSEEIVLPTWMAVLGGLQKVGKQFRCIEEMRQSNGELLQMIHKKIMQDYQVLEKEISLSAKSIEQIKQNLEMLKDEQQKLQKYETNNRNENNVELIYWLKKQYFEFTNLSLRIKQNEKNYRIHVQKVRYYKSKLNSFYKQQKEKYDKVIFTRYLSFLDSYTITIEESLKSTAAVFAPEAYRYRTHPGPPKVREMLRSKNMNEILAAELNYQEEYFERVEYYQAQLGSIFGHLEGIDLFLAKLKNIFGELVFKLKNEDNYSVRVDREGRKERRLDAKYFQPLFEQLSTQSKRIQDILANLERVNGQLRRDNQTQLQTLQRRLTEGCGQGRRILSSLSLEDGPIRQKYRLLKMELSLNYKQLQEVIGQVRFFWNVYQKHQNRLKKILLVSLIQFLNYQKRMICFDNYGEYLKQMADPSDSNNEEVNLLETTYEGKVDITEDFSLEKVNHLETGYVLAEEYKGLLNRFLFVAYTEWSNSQLFKQTISKQIYIALNEEINESFREIVVLDFALSGLPPQILFAKQLCSQQNEFLIDANINFRGKIWMKISTTYLFLNISVELQISIEQFYCVLRLCFISSELGCSWFSFIGEPIAKVLIKPKIADLQLDFDSIANMFQNMILKKLKENIYPIKKKISIPLYQKDETYQFIQKRYQAMNQEI